MEPNPLPPNIFLLNSDKSEVKILDFDSNYPKVFASFDSQHTNKISCMLPLFTPNNTLHSIITCSYDKQVKVWSYTPPNNFSLKHQCSTPKKITKAFLGVNNQVLFCDKYGDIFTFNPNELNPNEVKFEAQQIMGNLATIKIFQVVNFPEKQFLLISDEYFRMKVCRFPEIYDILAIWIPFEFMAKSIAVFKEGVLILFRSEQKKFKVCWVLKENFNKPEFTYNEIEFPDRILEDFQEEKREIFVLDEKEREVGVLQQIMEKEKVLIEIKVCRFEEKESKLKEIKKVMFEDKESVKIVKSERKRVVLSRKNNGEKENIERRELIKNVEIFEEKKMYILNVNLQ